MNGNGNAGQRMRGNGMATNVLAKRGNAAKRMRSEGVAVMRNGIASTRKAPRRKGIALK